MKLCLHSQHPFRIMQVTDTHLGSYPFHDKDIVN